MAHRGLSRKASSWFAVPLLAALTGCSSQPHLPGDSSVSVDLSVPDASRPGTPITEAVQSTCAISVLHLHIQRPAGSGSANERVAVIWGDIGREIEVSPPRIAYDAPLDGHVSNDVEVVLEALRLPFEENLLCTRACRDRAICPCIERPEVAIASVVVALDVDGDGALSLHEAREARRAEGQALVAWSTQRYVPPPIHPYFWEQKFPDGIEAGTCAYHLRHVNRLADQFLRPKTAAESLFDAIPCNGWGDCRDLEPIL